MAEFRQQMGGPNLGFTQVQPPTVNQAAGQRARSDAAVVEGVAGAARIGASLFGRYRARQAGERLAGTEESREDAASAVSSAGLEVEDLLNQRRNEVEGPVSPEAARDLRDETFGNVLTTQRRIESALSRGMISSTEANARLEVLRREALSNPLVAAFQDELDNAMFRHTGGSGTFGPTAEEQEMQAAREGELAAIEDVSQKATALVRTGVAASEDQARHLLGQREMLKMEQEMLAHKNAVLGLSSQEMYAYGQNLLTDFASTGYSQVRQWIAGGGAQENRQDLELMLQAEAEDIKAGIREAAFDEQGNLRIQESTLRSLLSEVDEELGAFNEMMEDQSKTERLLALIDERQAGMDHKNQSVQMELMNHLPLLYALPESGVPFYLNLAMGTQDLTTRWDELTNPVMAAIAKMHRGEALEGVSEVVEEINNGQEITPSEDTGRGIADTLQAPNRGLMKAAVALFMTQQKGLDFIRGAKEKHPEQTIINLQEMPFTVEQINNSEEFRRIRGEEDLDIVRAAVQGAARRAVTGSMISHSRRESSTELRERGGLWPERLQEYPVPAQIRVRPVREEQPSPGTMGAPVPRSRIRTRLEMDTGGTPTTMGYRQEVANAWELGNRMPEIWNSEFDSVDDWLNYLFTRPGE